MRTPIIYGNWKTSLRSWLDEHPHVKIALVVDAEVARLHDVSYPNTPVFSLYASESDKSLDTLERIWQFLHEHQLDRHSVLVVVGGGLTTDLGGFAAATYLRGIKAVYVPTTLLGMVDASMGGKTGINYLGYKNRIGSFTLPEVILQDASFLSTLSQDDWLSGWAETVKHALIANADLWHVCQSHKSLAVLQKEIKNILPISIEVKQNIVEKDFLEKGERKKLNFGHTIGHALESLYLQKQKYLPHGFAVAAGISMETQISHLMGYLPASDSLNIREYIDDIFPKVSVKPNEIKELLRLMRSDKKNKGAEIDFTLLDQIGSARVSNYPNEGIIESSIQSYIDGL